MAPLDPLEREAREEVLVAKAQCEERQRVLDEMSRELQESGWDGLINSALITDRLCLDEISKVQPYTTP